MNQNRLYLWPLERYHPFEPERIHPFWSLTLLLPFRPCWSKSTRQRKSGLTWEDLVRFWIGLALCFESQVAFRLWMGYYKTNNLILRMKPNYGFSFFTLNRFILCSRNRKIAFIFVSRRLTNFWPSALFLLFRWFHGDIPTGEAQRRLTNKPPGTYLVRFSTNNDSPGKK